MNAQVGYNSNFTSIMDEVMISRPLQDMCVFINTTVALHIIKHVLQQ